MCETSSSPELRGAGGVVNYLYESTASVTGLGGAPVATNPLFQPTPTEEEMREENYGASSDEDGGDATF